MAGGPSTPELAAAVSAAGGLGFIAAGYRSAEQLRDDIEATRALSAAPVGVNLFLVAETEVDEQRRRGVCPDARATCLPLRRPAGRRTVRRRSA